MRKFIVVVRDIKANLYFNPMFFQSLGQAERSFRDEVNRPAEGNTLAAHPQDFELFQVGTFDDETCSFDLLDKPLQIVHGSACVKAKST